MCVHVTFHVAAHAERFSANSARMWLLSGVNATMILQIAAGTESLVAILATIILLSSVNSSMNDERILASKIFAAIFTLELTLIRVYAHRVILQITPLTKMTATILALVRLVAAV